MTINDVPAGDSFTASFSGINQIYTKLPEGVRDEGGRPVNAICQTRLGGRVCNLNPTHPVGEHISFLACFLHAFSSKTSGAPPDKIFPAREEPSIPTMLLGVNGWTLERLRSVFTGSFIPPHRRLAEVMRA